MKKLFFSILLVGMIAAVAVLPVAALFGQTTDGTTDQVLPPTALVVILGVVAPMLIGVIKKAVTSATARFFIAVGLSAGLGILSALLNGIPLTNIPVFASAAFGLSYIFWKTWKIILQKE